MIDFRSKTRQRLLAYYFTNPTIRLHLRDLAKRIGADPANLSRDLRYLEQEGLFRSEVSGRQKYFRLNPQYPLFREVRGIVTKTIGAVPMLARALGKIRGLEEAYLYGSFARNTQNAASDIDVLIVGEPEQDVLAEDMRRLEGQLGREINYVVMNRRELEARMERRDAFLENVWQNTRVSLIGSDEKREAPSYRLGANRPVYRRRDQKGRGRRENPRIR